ncbi:hypothetical protein [Parasulfitobacter algicola]|nr:hypothetical protein [Sulfitobacter algicola]
MKIMMIAFAATALISVLAWVTLDYVDLAGFSAAEQGSGPSVRLD